MTKKHYYELDKLNMLLCLIVVFIHTFGKICDSMQHDSIYYVLSYSLLRNCAFVVQGFFFLSALKFVMIYKDRQFNYMNFLRTRLTKIVLPYIICVIAYYICFYKLSYFDKFSAKNLLIYILNGTISAPFYFIIALIQFYFFMPLWLIIAKKISNIKIFSISVAVYLVWTIFIAPYINFNDKIFISYLPFWCLGIIAGKNYDKYKQMFTSGRKSIIITLFFIVCCIFDGVFYLYTLNRNLTGAYSHIIHMLFCFSAILFVFNVCVISKQKVSYITKSVNYCSYYIYLLHCLLLAYVDKALYVLKINRLYLLFTYRVIFVYGFIILVSMLFYKLKTIKKV